MMPVHKASIAWSAIAVLVAFVLPLGCARVGASRAKLAPVDSCSISDVLGKGVTGFGSSYLQPNLELNATASFPVDGTKDIVIRWSLYETSAFEMDNIRAYEEQRFAVRYQPTAVEFVGSSTIAVAGCLGNAVVVETWLLQAPIEKTDVASGAVTLTLQARKEVRQVYSDTLGPGPGVVTQMAWNRGRERSLFCLFSVDRDLFELSWPAVAGEGALTPIASSGDFPYLAGKPYDSHVCGDHSLEGYVYEFGVDGELDLQPSLVLRDSDRDGVIDLISAMQSPEIVALQLASISMWHEYQGLDTPW